MHSSDTAIYFRVLGLDDGASIEQIKTKYRILAKELHPDTNSSAAAGRQFQLLNEAYQALIDGHAGRTAEPSQTDGSKVSDDFIQPIRCSRCNIVTAQPRFMIFKRAASFLIYSTQTPVQGIFCAECARKTALRSTILSGLFGWWGAPWGPIFTISAIFNNALGKHNREAERSLLWHNALAFAQAGNFRLALALSAKLAKEKDDKIEPNARKLIEAIR